MGLSFNRSEPGAWISGAAHGALLLAAIVSFSGTTLPESEEGIPVEVVTEAQVSEMTKGVRQASKVLPDPKPRVDRAAETREERDPGEAKRDAPAPPKRPVDMKVAEEEAAAPSAPAEPPRRPDPPKPDKAAEAKAEAARAEAAKAAAQRVAQARAAEAEKLAEQKEAEAIERAKVEAAAKAKALAAAKAKEEAEAKAEAKAELDARMKALAEADAKAKAEADRKAIADAKAKPDAKAKALAKADAEAKARKQAEAAEKFSPGDISKLLASKEPSQSSGATGRDIQKTASLGTAAGAAQRLNPSQRDQLVGLLSEQLHRCWQVPMAAQGADKPPVPTVRVKLNQDGSLAGEPVVMNSGGELFRTVAESATRATRRCAPLQIPARFQPFYQDWRDLVVNFDPRDVG